MSDSDRISGLPDPILHQILSSLPTTREAVRTSILSKRWRHLYLSVSSLRLDFNGYDAERFHLFLRRMLPHLNSSSIQMQTLQLAFSEDEEVDEPLLHECLLVAAKRSIQHLDLSLFPGEMPPCVFASQSLFTLRLEGCEIDAQDVRLSRLTKLELYRMDFGMCLGGKPISGCFALRHMTISPVKLISGCPALRHLTIEDCSIDGDLDISSHMLQTLNLIHTSFSGVLSVSASALLSFKLELWEARGCTLRGLSSLVSAYIDVPTCYDFLDILEGLHNVQELELGSNVLQGQLPTFWRLKKLKLNTYLSSGPIQAITCLLQFFPNLEELVIMRCEGSNFCPRSFVLSEPSEDFLGNLKLVELHGWPRTQRLKNFWLAHTEGPEKKLIAKIFEN